MREQWRDPLFVRPKARSRPGLALVAAHDKKITRVTVEQFALGTTNDGFKDCAMAVAAYHRQIHRMVLRLFADEPFHRAGLYDQFEAGCEIGADARIGYDLGEHLGPQIHIMLRSFVRPEIAGGGEIMGIE